MDAGFETGQVLDTTARAKRVIATPTPTQPRRMPRTASRLTVTLLAALAAALMYSAYRRLDVSSVYCVRTQQRIPTSEPPHVSAAAALPVSITSVTPRPLELAAASSSTRTISCPIFSGPGYVRANHPSHNISVPALPAPYSSEPRPRPHLEPLPLSDVRLLPGSAYYSGFRTNLLFLKRVDLDALLLTWRLQSRKGWPKGAFRLMGWEHTGSELRGHFLGHWLLVGMS